MEQNQPTQEQNTPQVDVQKVVNSLLRQITDAAHKISILEALLESK